jgi:hypothetical protein
MQKIALTAAWIFALYPDGILVGSSQMREPFLMGLACIAFWAVLQWREKPFKALLIPVNTMIPACLFSIPSGSVIIAVLAAVFLTDWTFCQTKKRRRILGYSLLLLLGFSALIGGWSWLKETLYYDAYITRISSGWISALINQYGDKWNIPFTTLYGLTQPLLPAAIFEPSVPFWVAIAIIRGLAWYAALPILFYGVFAVWKTKTQNDWLIKLFYIVFFIWVVVSSARAGGDLWDNPRYRFILLPFMAIIIAWAVEQYQRSRSPWLWRWGAVICVFLLLFTNFYANRYTESLGFYIPFIQTAGLIVLFSLLIIGSGLALDFITKKRKIP